MSMGCSYEKLNTHKLMEPRWIGMKGAFATRSPSGANRAQEKSRRSLIFVLIEVCCNDLPMASATLIKRLAKRVSRMGSGAFILLEVEDMVGDEETKRFG